MELGQVVHHGTRVGQIGIEADHLVPAIAHEPVVFADLDDLIGRTRGELLRNADAYVDVDARQAEIHRVDEALVEKAGIFRCQQLRRFRFHSCSEAQKLGFQLDDVLFHDRSLS